MFIRYIVHKSVITKLCFWFPIALLSKNTPSPSVVVVGDDMVVLEVLLEETEDVPLPGFKIIDPCIPFLQWFPMEQK